MLKRTIFVALGINVVVFFYNLFYLSVPLGLGRHQLYSASVGLFGQQQQQQPPLTGTRFVKKNLGNNNNGQPIDNETMISLDFLNQPLLWHPRKQYEVVIGLHHWHGGRVLRYAVRNTWCKYDNVFHHTLRQTSPIRVWFYTGKIPGTPEVMSESWEYQDIVFLNSNDRAHDDKSKAYWKWLASSPFSYKWVGHVDDDAFVYTPLLLDFLSFYTPSRTLIGSIDRRKKPLKACHTVMYKLPFVLGLGFVVSSDVAHTLADALNNTMPSYLVNCNELTDIRFSMWIHWWNEVNNNTQSASKINVLHTPAFVQSHIAYKDWYHYPLVVHSSFKPHQVARLHYAQFRAFPKNFPEYLQSLPKAQRVLPEQSRFSIPAALGESTMLREWDVARFATVCDMPMCQPFFELCGVPKSTPSR